MSFPFCFCLWLRKIEWLSKRLKIVILYVSVTQSLISSQIMTFHQKIYSFQKYKILILFVNIIYFTPLQEILQPSHSLKKSFPLSSTTIKAGKSLTSIFQTASIPSSSLSRTSTLVIQFLARIAAGPPTLPK